MASRDIFSKYLPNVKLATRYDADGKEVPVERREDADATLKEQETFELLLSAGYYRAKMKDLPAFDKIVGGMTWCIACCDFDIDVNLLFHEKLSIGQKITLVEQIVAVLPEMKCPFQIEPHQIQSLEFISIYPVIEWLVKRTEMYNASKLAERKNMVKNDETTQKRLALLQEVGKNAIDNSSDKLNESNVIPDLSELKILEATKIALAQQLQRNQKDNEDLMLEANSQKEQLRLKIEEKSNLIAEIKRHKLAGSKVNDETSHKVQKLVSELDKLKKEESEFKENCRKCLSDLQKEIEELESIDKQDPAVQAAAISKEKSQMQQLKLQLAKRNRGIVAIQRQLDSIPDRTELAQYQRRFHELYNEMSAKHIETKQYFTLFNTLNDKKRYLDKELLLLNSICESYNDSLASAQSREEFLLQFETIVKGVKLTEEKIRRKFTEERSKRDILHEDLQSLLELQRQYAAAVKQLTRECQSCEQLQQHLKLLRSK